jgi:hypothetical protein
MSFRKKLEDLGKFRFSDDTSSKSKKKSDSDVEGYKLHHNMLDPLIEFGLIKDDDDALSKLKLKNPLEGIELFFTFRFGHVRI